MRLIDADALLRALDVGEDCDNCQYKMGVFCKQSSEFVDVCEAIADAPTIEPERNKGKWERHYSRPNVYADLFWHCSECGYKNENQYADKYHNFCPNCGADMREEGAE